MLKLDKYLNNGQFIFTPNDRLSQVCNAPGKEFKYGGIYLIHAMKGNVPELVYVGISGRIDKVTSKLIPRSDGIKGRIVNGKRDGEPRKNYWIREMLVEKIDALKISWYVVHDNDTFRDCPNTIEKQIIAKYRPRWNRI